MAIKIREKRKILFSKCDVIVAKVEDKSLNCIKIGINSTRTSFTKGEKVIKDDSRVVCYTGKGGRDAKCISPLGFYYYKDVSHIKAKKVHDEVGIRCKHVIGITGGYYEITYLAQLNDTSIGHETRPWDLIGNGIEDHLVKDLERLLSNLIVSLEDYGYKKDYLKEFKNTLFIDLFGSVDGIKTQTNEGKILSHGFDLKTSFRKRKET